MIIVNLIDGETQWDDDICIMSELLKSLYYEDIDLSRGETKHQEKFDLNFVSKDIAEKYENICKAINDKFEKKELFDMLDYDDVNKLFKVLNLANFLDNAELIKLIDEKITDEIQEKPFSDIKKMYNLNDEDISEDLQNQLNLFDSVSMPLFDTDSDDSDDSDDE